MKIYLYDIIIGFQRVCIIVAFFFSIRLIGNKSMPRYMRKFYWYSGVAAVTAVFHSFRRYSSENVAALGIPVNNLLVLFHFVFLSYFIYSTLPLKRQTAYIIIFILTLLLVLFSLFTSKIQTPQSNAFAISNLGLVIFCCFYYYQLFQTAPVIDLLREPAFWIINGIFICMCATVPILAIRYYLLDNSTIRLYSYIETAIPFAYGMMHLFFIKAYLCSTSLRKA